MITVYFIPLWRESFTQSKSDISQLKENDGFFRSDKENLIELTASNLTTALL